MSTDIRFSKKISQPFLGNDSIYKENLRLMDFFKFNKIYVIESLLNEPQTGKSLFNDIIKIRSRYHSDLLTEFVQVLSLEAWTDTIKRIIQEVKDNLVIPILHFELHGSSNHDGLVLANGELIPWRDFVSDMRCINIATQNNLFITMGICFGMEILYHTSLKEPSPFFGIIGSLYALENDDIYIRYCDFYNEFLQSFDIIKSLECLFKANPGRPQEYSFVNAPELFRRVYEHYLKTQFTPDAIRKRTSDAIKEAETKRGLKYYLSKEKKVFAKRFKKELKKSKEPFYLNHFNNFLMCNKFETCKKRFAIPRTTKEFLETNWNDIMPTVIS